MPHCLTRRNRFWKAATSLVAGLVLLLAVAAPSGATSRSHGPRAATGKLFASGLTAPGGMVWLGTHLWVSDHLLGFCRLDDPDGDGSFAINEQSCNTAATWPGQPTYEGPVADDPRHFVYVPDSSPTSQGVWRLEFDPLSEMITHAVLMAPGRGLAGARTTATALGPDASLYVGSLENGEVVRITNRRGRSAAQRVQQVGRSFDGHGIASLALLGSTLYLAEGGAVTELGPVETCSGECTAAAADIVLQGAPTALASGPDALYVADSGEVFGQAEVLLYTPGNSTPSRYAQASDSGDAFTFVSGLALDVAGNLFVADDPGNGVRAGRLFAVAAPLAPAPEPIAASGLTPEATSLWEGAGVFVEIAADIPATRLAETLHENGFRWVAVMTHHGLETLNEDALESSWLEPFRAAGLSVGSWGYNQTEPEAEAEVAAELVERFGLDFHIANAELEYKCSGDDGLCSGEVAAAAERFARSGRFVRAFRELVPELPAAVSTYGRVDRANLDWSAWRAGGFHLLPQAYLNEREMDDPVLCAEGAAVERWDLGAVHPTIGAYDTGAGDVPVEEYVDRLQEAGTTGFSVYLAHHVADEDYGVLGEAIETGSIAAAAE